MPIKSLQTPLHIRNNGATVILTLNTTAKVIGHEPIKNIQIEQSRERTLKAQRKSSHLDSWLLLWPVLHMHGPGYQNMSFTVAQWCPDRFVQPPEVAQKNLPFKASLGTGRNTTWRFATWSYQIKKPMSRMPLRLVDIYNRFKSNYLLLHLEISKSTWGCMS